MAKIMTVQEALDSMSAKKNANGKIVINRFNKKNFNTLMLAMANDVNFKTEMAKVKKGELDSVEDVMVTKGFRQWCKTLIEKAGVDKSESVRVLDDEFVIPNMEGLYEFFASALYEYINAGNQFDFIPTKEFKGGIYIKNIDEKTTVADAHSPQDRSYLGTFETTKKKHKELGVKTGCPAFLQSRKRVDKK
jgi:hypothetical protein